MTDIEEFKRSLEELIRMERENRKRALANLPSTDYKAEYNVIERKEGEQ